MSLPTGLLILIGYLGLIALGNLIGIFHGIFTGDTAEIYTSLPGFVLYSLPAYGLFKRLKWAWFMEITISGIAVLFGLLVFLLFNPLMGAIACLVHTVIIIYLWKKSSKSIYFIAKTN